MRDYGSDLTEDEVVELRAPKHTSEDDGWDDVLSLDVHRSANPDSNSREVQPDRVTDGWGDDQPKLVSQRAEDVGGDAPGQERSTELHAAEHEAGGGVDDRQVDVPDLNASRDAVEAAFRTTDLPADTLDASDFQKKVTQSEAQEVKSLAEAEDYARENLGIERVDYSGFDERTANDVNATLEVLQDKYPDVKGLDYVGSMQSRNEAIVAEQPELADRRPDIVSTPRDGVIAVALSGTEGFDGISINQPWAKNYEWAARAVHKDEVKGGSAMGTGSMTGVVAHEFGHVLEQHLRSEGKFDEVDGLLQSIWDCGPASVVENVSFYAATDKDRHELFAELFAEYQLNPEPREPARELGSLVDEILYRH